MCISHQSKNDDGKSNNNNFNNSNTDFLCIYNIYIYVYLYIYVYCMYIYIYACMLARCTNMVARGYLPLGDLFILSFLHLHFLQPLQHFVPYAKMKCAFRCGFSTQRCIFHWYLHDSMALILPDSCSLKSSFLICSFGRQSMIAANSLVRLA